MACVKAQSKGPVLIQKGRLGPSLRFRAEAAAAGRLDAVQVSGLEDDRAPVARPLETRRGGLSVGHLAGRALALDPVVAERARLAALEAERGHLGGHGSTAIHL